MSEPHRSARLALARVRGPLRAAASRAQEGRENFETTLAAAGGDAVLLEWDGPLEGLYAHLGAAARARRVTFPARWLPARSAVVSGVPSDGSDGASLLAFARSDAALQRLFADSDPQLAERGLGRPDEPVVLLGVAGDALTRDADSGPTELRRRAESWIARLGADRVAIAVPASAPEDHPLVQLARHRGLSVVEVGPAGEVDTLVVGSPPPLLWTDFQLDTEHRLPDEGWIPGLRDLLHRGALLRERVLYENLPAAWRSRVDAELRALYAWQVSPLLRRVATLVQTFASVEGVRHVAPLPALHSLSAYLLGVSDRRPDETTLALTDPVRAARELAESLLEMDRRFEIEVSARVWPRLMARLLPWCEGGHLALCSGGPERGRRFCFSGQPLGLRAPVVVGRDGLPRVGLDEADRLALGWFELDLVESAEPVREVAAPAASVLEFEEPRPQLDLDLGAPPAQEKSA